MAAKKKQKVVPFNDRLILFRYFLKQFGKETLKALAGELNRSEYEGYNEHNNTWFFVHLQQYCRNNRLSVDLLRRYDENICRYVREIGANRGGIVLKYYQYIALLFTEMYLDRYFTARDAFIKDLNNYIDEINAALPDTNRFAHYTSETMNKLAFMCATGSGKTLIMHINIKQYLFYMKKARKRSSINKIIVLTPNEGLSEQHLEELKLSGINASVFSKDLSSVSAGRNEIVIIDINKLDEEGKVKTIDVDSFEQNNLVLVDEGHKGLTGDVWYDYRTRLSANGFSFEYSATFKQALKSQKAKDMEKLLAEYGKVIIMDYSYKYFYEDGYGKDYRIYNFKETGNSEQKELYLVGCLMSFYQQLKLYHTYPDAFKPFRLEKPLLVFVGNRVTATVTAAELTDVEEVLAFLDRFVKNKAETIKRIHAILSEDTGLTDGAGNELFLHDFDAIRSIYDDKENAEIIFADIMKIVFNADSVPDQPRLHIVHMKQADGEIGLKIGEYNDFFGVISVGDAASLCKKCQADGMITDTEEFISDAMFRTINDKNSKINVLIGSRKFSEGWNSWRVSTMGLINFAKGEGSQAIQLFGRGVRLKGYNGCLKRSEAVNRDHPISIPEYIHPLETLTIFGIKAQYMEDFKKFLEMEDVGANETVYQSEIKVINRFPDIKDKELQIIRLPKNVIFKKQSPRLLLSPPDDLLITYLAKHRILIDCRSKVQTIESDTTLHTMSTTEEHTISDSIIPYLDYEQIYTELEQYKNEKLYYNLIIDKAEIEKIMKANAWYSLLIPQTHITINSFEKLQNATDYAVMALKVYMDRFFTFHKELWETPYMEYQTITSDDSNFVDKYTIRYTETGLNGLSESKINEFANEVNHAVSNDKGIKNFAIALYNHGLAALDFPNHLYAPLISVDPEVLKIQVSPVAMNEGEREFVKLLHEYVTTNPPELNGKELYLLRNQSKSGMGFFEAGNFYPDFILWIKEEGIQRISFVDPKGLTRLTPDNPKIAFFQKIKELQSRLQPKSKISDRIILNSFIMSITPSLKLRGAWNMNPSELEARNVYCLDNEHCISSMIHKILSDNG